MGYNLYITRKENWFDEEDSNNISPTEWTDYLKSDSEMRSDNFSEAFWPDNGNIVVKNPDIEIRNKMIDIAGQLSAKVQGDDGEFYDTKESITEKRPWWKVWS